MTTATAPAGTGYHFWLDHCSKCRKTLLVRSMEPRPEGLGVHGWDECDGSTSLVRLLGSDKEAVK